MAAQGGKKDKGHRQVISGCAWTHSRQEAQFRYFQDECVTVSSVPMMILDSDPVSVAIGHHLIKIPPKIEFRT